jgi:DNA-binding response OmpR family regulator
VAKILLIDEDVAFLASLGNRLEEAGFRVVKTIEPDHHAVLIEEEQPDLVVMEVHLQNDGGWDLLEKLVARLPVIILSMNGHEENVVRGLALGALDYITKPYRSEELIARLRLRLGQQTAPSNGMSRATAATPTPKPTTAQQVPEESLPAESQSEDATTSATPESESESVFMSEAEEQALLRMRGDEATPAREPLPPQGADSSVSLGQQFNLERQRRRLTLVQAESELKVPMSYLQAIEDDKFTLLPRGPIATQMVQQYADYLNLDTAFIVQEFQRLYYADPAEPHPALGGPRLRRNLPVWLAPAIAVMLALVISLSGLYYFDRDGVNSAVSNLRALVLPQENESAPVPSPTVAPTPAPTITPESSGAAPAGSV